jgi:hypothetical protein
MKVIPILFVLAIFYSCVEVEPVSPIPEIKFVSFNIDSNTVDDNNVFPRILEFDFIDGDADLGVYDEIHANDSDYTVEERFGIFIHFFEKVDTNYIERFFTEERVEEINDKENGGTKDTLFIDTIYLHQQLPYDEKLDRVGQNKMVKGTIRVELFFPPTLPYDTMKLEFYIRDRGLNKSNIEETNDFVNISSSIGGIGIPD